MKNLILEGTPQYEQVLSERTYNARRPNRRPFAVLLAEGEREVFEGVRLAQRYGWQVAVRSSGHSWSSWPLQDNALLIDVKGLREFSYDPETQIAQAGPGVLGGTELRPFLAQVGRFVPTGHHHTVGLGGYLLCGGHAWATRGFGWSAEYVTAVDVVTADGRLLRADASQNSDLYWAARGAGPAFPGVVTRYHLRTRPLPGHIAHSTQLYPIEVYDQVMPWLIREHRKLGSTVEVFAFRFPSHPLAPGHQGNLLGVTALSFADTAKQASAELAPLEGAPSLRQALVHIVAEPISIERYISEIVDDPETPEYGKVRTLATNAWIDAPADQAAKLMRRTFFDADIPDALVFWSGFAPLRELPDMAFDMQSESYFVIAVMPRGESDDERLLQWRDDRMRELKDVTVGQYIGEVDQNVQSPRFMSEDHYERLSQVVRRYDAECRFVRYPAR